MNPLVYKIEFPDGSFYVGCSVNFAERRRTHLRHARKGKAVNKLLQEKFNEFHVCGIYPVACAFDRHSLHLLEQQIMDQDRPPLNIAPATPVPPENLHPARPWGAFPNLRAAAATLGIPYSSVKKAAKAFETPAEYLAHKEAKRAVKEKRAETARSNTQKVLVGGVLDYPRNHRKRLGIGVGLYRKRKRQGLTVEEALSAGPYVPPQRVSKPKEPQMRKLKLTVRGTERTLDEWAVLAGVTKNCLYSRLRNGWTPEQAVGLEPSDTKKKVRAREEEAREHKALRASLREKREARKQMTRRVRELKCSQSLVESEVQELLELWSALHPPSK